MSWFWIGLAVVLPFVVGLAIAWPFWRRPSRDPVGTVLGAFVVVASGVALVGREFIHLQRLTNQCITTETVCRFFPEPFTRFFIYIAIAMAQVFVLFIIGSASENRIRSRAFAAEWRQR
jgi:succinate dehydrogenase hydrophobic anchor subunit